MKMLPLLSLLFCWSLLLFAPLTVTAQKGNSLLDRIRQLEVDRLEAGIPVFYSAGYADRAAYLARQINASDAFYQEHLGVTVDIRLALLDTADYAKLGAPYPYGLPYVNNGTIVMPADTSLGSVRAIFAPYRESASPGILSDLKAGGYSYRAAVNRMVDLIGLHEIGHTQIYALQIDARQRWLDEFLASYFAYAYLRAREPELAVVWDRVIDALLAGYQPQHHRLDTLNELYAGVGVADYGWFQSVFQDRIREVYESRGLDFIRVLQKQLADKSFQPASASELLDFLETIEPGFRAWAERWRLE